MQKRAHSLKGHSTVHPFRAEAKRRLQFIRVQGKKFSKKAVFSVDQYAHKEPWRVVAFLSFIAGFLGFTMGRKGKHK